MSNYLEAVAKFLEHIWLGRCFYGLHGLLSDCSKISGWFYGLWTFVICLLVLSKYAEWNADKVLTLKEVVKRCALDTDTDDGLSWTGFVNAALRSVAGQFSFWELLKTIDFLHCFKLKGLCFLHDVCFHANNLEVNQCGLMRHIICHSCTVYLNSLCSDVDNELGYGELEIDSFPRNWPMLFLFATLREAVGCTGCCL